MKDIKKTIKNAKYVKEIKPEIKKPVVPEKIVPTPVVEVKKSIAVTPEPVSDDFTLSFIVVGPYNAAILHPKTLLKNLSIKISFIRQGLLNKETWNVKEFFPLSDTRMVGGLVKKTVLGFGDDIQFRLPSKKSVHGLNVKVIVSANGKTFEQEKSLIV